MALFDPHGNFGYATVTVAPSPPGTGTTLTLGTTSFGAWPAPGTGHNAVVWPAGTLPLTTNAEIIRIVTQGTNGTVEFSRNQESSGTRIVAVGDQVALSWTSKKATDIEDYFTSGTADYVLTGNGVGTAPTWQPPAGDGWTAVTGTWTFSSADGPTGVITVPTDATLTYSVGMRVKLTQTTVKYFIVTAIAATSMTVYGGTDYTLANAAISAISYSAHKAPLGFPTSPLKWTESTTSTADVTQASPTDGTFYNPGTLSLSVPIGAWRLYFKGVMNGNKSGGGTKYLTCALSTSGTSVSNTNLQAYHRVNTGIDDVSFPFFVEDTVLLAAKTSYYAIASSAAGTITSVGFLGSSLGATMIRGESGYL